MERLANGELFDHSAIKKMTRLSRGIPRLVNILAHKALMLAYGRGEYRINSKHISMAGKDTEDVQFNYWMAGLVVALFLAGSFSALLWSGWLV